MIYVHGRMLEGICVVAREHDSATVVLATVSEQLPQIYTEQRPFTGGAPLGRRTELHSFWVVKIHGGRFTASANYCRAKKEGSSHAA